jgi:hypothetical protein
MDQQNNASPPTLSEETLNHLIEINDIEEVYAMIENFSDEQINTYLAHFKDKKQNAGESKLAKVVHAVSKKEDLKQELENEIIPHFKERHREIAAKISELRKGGKDVEVEWIHLMMVPLKIKMFAATRNKKDFFKVKNILDEIDKSLNQK